MAVPPMNSAMEAKRQPHLGEDYGETFVRPFDNQAPVLKRAATAFADMLASSSDISNTIGDPFALPLWDPDWENHGETPPDTDDLLDLDIPFVPDHLLEDYPCDQLQKDETILQYPMVDEHGNIGLKQWSTWSQLQLPPYGTPLDSIFMDPKECGGGGYMNVNHEGYMEFNKNVHEGRLMEDGKGSMGKDVVLDEDGSSITEFSSSGTPAAAPLELPRPCGFHEAGDSCTEDCNMLVDTICNLSKVLLAHYESKTVAGSGKIQAAVLNLSKCLLHAHRSTTTEESQMAEAEAEAEDEDVPVESAYEEEVSRNYERLVLEKCMKVINDPELHKETMARLKEKEVPTEQEIEKVNHERPLVRDSIEERLAILRARPSNEVNSGSTIITSEKGLDAEGGIERQLFGVSLEKHTHSLDLEDVNDKHEPEDGVAVLEDLEPEKSNKLEIPDKSDSEESSWEQV